MRMGSDLWIRIFICFVANSLSLLASVLFIGCEENTMESSVPPFAASDADGIVSMLPGGEAVIDLSGGRQPYRISHETDRHVAISTLLGSAVNIDAVDFGRDTLVVEDSTPGPGGGNRIEIAVHIGVDSTGVTGVSGLVRDVDGFALPNVILFLNGVEVQVEPGGSFAADSVVVPYDAAIVVPDLQLVQIFHRLTRSDPSLTLLAHATPSKTGTITGVVPILPTPFSLESSLSFVADGDAWQTIGRESYSLQVTWWGSPQEMSGTVYYHRLDSLEDGTLYTSAVAEKKATVSAGQASVVNFLGTDIRTPGFMWIGGETDASQSYILFGRQAFVELEGAPVLLTEELWPLEVGFLYKAPVWIGATHSIKSFAGQVTSHLPARIIARGHVERRVGPSPRVSTYTKTGISAATFDVSTYVGGAPALEEPPEGATGVTFETKLRWYQGGGDGVNAAYLLPHDPSGAAFVILTLGASTTLPDYSALGINVQPGAVYDWYVLREYPLASIDETATDAYIPFLEEKLGDIGVGYSEVNTFTTADTLQ